MLHSTVTKKGQTTIPGEIRQALGIKPGDRLEYSIEGDRVMVRVHPGAKSLAGSLASDKGKGMTFDEIRRVVAAKRRRERAL